VRRVPSTSDKSVHVVMRAERDTQWVVRDERMVAHVRDVYSTLVRSNEGCGSCLQLSYLCWLGKHESQSWKVISVCSFPHSRLGSCDNTSDHCVWPICTSHATGEVS
jgi:hypothetical protein